MSKKELSTKVHQLRKLNAKAEELAAEIEKIKSEIKAEIEAQGVDEVSGSDWHISWKPVTSTRFDSAAFKKTHGDLYGQYCKETTSRRFLMA